MTEDEEMKIRVAWGDHVMHHGIPAFCDKRFRMPIRVDVSPFVSDAEIKPELVVDSYEFVVSVTAERRDDYERKHYIETTIECSGVIVFRDWTVKP